MKAFRFLLAIIAILVLAQASRVRLLFVLDYALLGVLVFSFIWARFSLYWIEIQRDGSHERSQVGENFKETLVLKNHSILPRLWLEVRDSSDLPGHNLTCVQSLKPLEKLHWQASTICRMRGRYRLGPLTITAGDPFGLFRFKRNLPAHRFLTVYPPAFNLHQFEGLSGALPGGNSISRPTNHITPNINGLRDYQPGDSLNRIHWASSARQRRLIVKEFEFDPALDVQIFLDMNKATHWVLDPQAKPPRAIPAAHATFRTMDSTEEYAVAAAATLCRHFIQNGRNVGMVSWGQHHEQISPDRGERQLMKLYEALAVIRAEGQTDFAQLLAAEIPRLRNSDTLLLVTSSLAESWVSVLPLILQKKIKIAVAFIEPATFGLRQSSLLTIGALASMNIPTFMIKRGDDFSQSLNTELGRLVKRFG